MKRYGFIIAYLIAFPVLAQEPPQRIPDLSLSPQETLQQPNISRSQSGGYSNGFQQPANDAIQQRMNGDMPDESYNADQNSRFMTGYCDPNFKPLVANAPGLSGLQSCLESQKQQACDTFQNLPADAQAALDDTIGCLYAASENNTADGQPSASDPACAANDSRRLRLLKKYWRDEHIAQSLVFMPDDVLNASGKCMRGGK